MSGLIFRMLVAIRGSIPFLIGILFACFTFAQYGTSAFSLVVPPLTLPVIYYWTLRHPDLMPAWAALLIGLWQDILVGGPLGLMALLLVLMRAAVDSQRSILLPQSGLIRWFGYALISFGLVALGWVVAGLWSGTVYGPLPFLGHWALGVVLYGVFAFLFGQIDRFLFERA
ncbi:MAG: rod shape-determining protein MreD [Alphaproteobacteria bacterium]